MLSDAIRAHHDLLTDDSATASQERLDEQQERRGLSFGNRARCTVLRARFLSVDEYRFLRSRTNALLPGIRRRLCNARRTPRCVVAIPRGQK